MPGSFKELSDGLQKCMWAWKYVTDADAEHLIWEFWTWANGLWKEKPPLICNFQEKNLFVICAKLQTKQ